VDGTFGTTGIWHFPAPTIRSTSGRPVRVQWLNELPGTLPPVNLDPTVDCGANAPYCYPYNRIVTHVHGAHVGPESDGFANAWFTSGFTTTGPDFIDTSATPYNHGPKNTGYYPNDQQAATIWYHDHAMGTTHQNTQMGLAGFWPITDDNEKYLQGQAVQGVNGGNPGPTLIPYDTAGTYDLGFALQDRTFYTDGQIAMPDYPVYDYNTGLPGGSPPIAFDPVSGLPIPCALLANGLADPSTCKRLDWMYSADGTHLIPYDEANTAALSIPKNSDAPFGAPSTTLEYFGNMPMVNGVTYGKYNVESTVYRMRFIGGSDSRTWIMALNTQQDDLGTSIPFYQIASEQGFLNAPLQRSSMLLMPGERLDVLVDFTGLAPGTRIYLNNLGSDEPFQGEANPVRSADIPVIMVFDVTGPPASPSVDVLPSAIPTTGTPLRPVLGAIQPLTQTPGTTVRKISLMEITDQYGRTLPTIDSRGFMPMGVPITETMLLNDVETWELINTTADAHPMHLHLVQFQVLGRTPFDNTSVPPAPTAFVPPVTDTDNGIYREPSYTATGPLVPPDPWDAGWKDTVYTPPGFVTTVRAKFDILGTYVWHCHILSHEEHDMMRPQVVVTPITSVNLTPGVSSPQVTTASPVVFTASNVVGGSGSTTSSVTTVPEYRFSYKLTADGNWTLGRDYSTQPTWSWNLIGLAGGNYDIKVDVRNVGVVRDSEASATVTSFLLVAPAITVNPGTGSFGNVAVNYTSYPTTVTISNTTGNGFPISVTGISLTGSDPGMFILNNGSCGTLPKPLNDGASCNVQVSFKPTAPGALSASLNVVSDAPVASVNLSGTGVAATNPARRTSAPSDFYPTLAAAFTAATSSATLEAWGAILPTSSVTVDSSGTVTFTGGFDAQFGSRSGTMTAMQGGTLIIKDGTLVVDGLTIQ
jgi:spore coat protein A